MDAIAASLEELAHLYRNSWSWAAEDGRLGPDVQVTKYQEIGYTLIEINTLFTLSGQSLLKRCTSGVKLLIRMLRLFRIPFVHEILWILKWMLVQRMISYFLCTPFLEFDMAVLPPIRPERRKILALRLHRDKTYLIVNSLESRKRWHDFLTYFIIGWWWLNTCFKNGNTDV